MVACSTKQRASLRTRCAGQPRSSCSLRSAACMPTREQATTLNSHPLPSRRLHATRIHAAYACTHQATLGYKNRILNEPTRSSAMHLHTDTSNRLDPRQDKQAAPHSSHQNLQALVKDARPRRGTGKYHKRRHASSSLRRSPHRRRQRCSTAPRDVTLSVAACCLLLVWLARKRKPPCIA